MDLGTTRTGECPSRKPLLEGPSSSSSAWKIPARVPNRRNNVPLPRPAVRPARPGSATNAAIPLVLAIAALTLRLATT